MTYWNDKPIVLGYREYQRSRKESRIMNYFDEKMQTASKIYNALGDELSRKLFDMRMNYYVNKNEQEFLIELNKLPMNYYHHDFNQFMKSFSNEDIVIFGAGNEGKRAFFILNQIGFGKRVVAYADNNPRNWNQKIDGIPIVSIDDLKKRYSEAVILIATYKYAPDIYGQLLVYGFDRNLIFYPRFRRFMANAGHQYFDLLELKKEKDEVFIDAGAYDGTTSVEFVDWCEGDYEAIYSFEPDINCKERCESNFEKHGLQNAFFINKGTWREESILKFAADGGAGARFSEKGNIEVQVTSIDQVLQGKRATYIKMDVEGSELDSLYGAKKTIKTWHPKLAICIYHKPEDIYEIPKYILELNQDYKFYIRHYCSYIWETVLYAI